MVSFTKDCNITRVPISLIHCSHSRTVRSLLAQHSHTAHSFLDSAQQFLNLIFLDSFHMHLLKHWFLSSSGLVSTSEPRTFNWHNLNSGHLLFWFLFISTNTEKVQNIFVNSIRKVQLVRGLQNFKQKLQHCANRNYSLLLPPNQFPMLIVATPEIRTRNCTWREERWNAKSPLSVVQLQKAQREH